MRNERTVSELQNEAKDVCPECGSDRLAFEAGELYCVACGFVID